MLLYFVYIHNKGGEINEKEKHYEHIHNHSYYF